MRTNFVALAAALCLCGALAACGGGGGGTEPAAPAPTPTTTPSSQTGTVPVSASAVTAPIPAIAGFSGSVSLPPSNAAGGTTIAATSTTTAPSGVPSLQSSLRVNTGTAPTVYFFESFTASTTVTFNGVPGFSLTLPSSISTAGQAFYVALLAPGMTQWQMAAEGPAQINGQTLTFPEQTGTTVTLTAGQTYWFAFYSIPAGSITPAPSPTPTATPTPAPTATPTPAPLGVAPSSLSLTGTGASNMQAFAITGGTAPFTVSGYDASVISVSVDPSSSTAYDVTPLKGGQTTITVKDSTGASSTISVSVTTVSGVIQ